MANSPLKQPGILKSLLQGIEKIDNATTAHNISQKLAGELEKVLEKPLNTIDTSEFEKYLNSLGSLNLGPSPQLSGTDTQSSITTIQELSDIIHNDPSSSLTLAEVLKRHPEELRRELIEISLNKFEMQFNYIAYPLLTEIEILIRNLINERICKPYSSNIRTKIPEEVLEQWKRRKRSEEENRIIECGFSLIDYSDFTDLKKILEKGRNYQLFSDIFNMDELKAVTSKLHELDPIRKKIAHSRPLSQKELNRLKIYSEDITGFMKK